MGRKPTVVDYSKEELEGMQGEARGLVDELVCALQFNQLERQKQGEKVRDLRRALQMALARKHKGKRVAVSKTDNDTKVKQLETSLKDALDVLHNASELLDDVLEVDNLPEDMRTEVSSFLYGKGGMRRVAGMAMEHRTGGTLQEKMWVVERIIDNIPRYWDDDLKKFGALVYATRFNHDDAMTCVKLRKGKYGMCYVTSQNTAMNSYSHPGSSSSTDSDTGPFEIRDQYGWAWSESAKEWLSPNQIETKQRFPTEYYGRAGAVDAMNKIKPNPQFEPRVVLKSTPRQSRWPSRSDKAAPTLPTKPAAKTYVIEHVDGTWWSGSEWTDDPKKVTHFDDTKLATKALTEIDDGDAMVVRTPLSLTATTTPYTRAQLPSRFSHDKGVVKVLPDDEVA